MFSQSVALPGVVVTADHAQAVSVQPHALLNTPENPYTAVRHFVVDSAPVNFIPETRFSVEATHVIGNSDIDQPIRYLDVPALEPIEIDERLTLGRSLFGDKFADLLAVIRTMKILSAIVFNVTNVSAIIGLTLFFFETFQVNAGAVVHLRWSFICLFPIAMFHLVCGALRMITTLFRKCLRSFDVLYLTAQAILYGAGWCFIFRTDIALVLYGVFSTTTTLNAVFSDAMSEKSRQRTGGATMILLCIVVSFSIIVWKLSPNSEFHSSFVLPGSQWLTDLGYHPIVVNPIDMCIERLVTIFIFFSKFLYKQHYYPNAALNLQIPYVRRVI